MGTTTIRVDTDTYTTLVEMSKAAGASLIDTASDAAEALRRQRFAHQVAGELADLWLVNFGEPHPGEPVVHRPALVLGPPDTFGPGSPFIIVAPLTTTRRDLSLHVEIEADSATGLQDTSYVQCELVRSINRNRLARRIGASDSDTSHRIATIVRTLLNYRRPTLAGLGSPVTSGGWAAGPHREPDLRLSRAGR